ncbi:hypothetical protein LQZ18_18305 [Lachnospiraceae bacterium ZAX-1]
MIRGRTIQLSVKSAVALDSLGNPIQEEVLVDVPNILIEPTSDQEVLETTDLYGRKAKYTLHIPKGDTNDWESTEVLFYGERWRTIGKGREWMEENTPTAWNKKVYVESEVEADGE